MEHGCVEDQPQLFAKRANIGQIRNLQYSEMLRLMLRTQPRSELRLAIRKDCFLLD